MGWLNLVWVITQLYIHVFVFDSNILFILNSKIYASYNIITITYICFNFTYDTITYTYICLNFIYLHHPFSIVFFFNSWKIKFLVFRMYYLKKYIEIELWMFENK